MQEPEEDFSKPDTGDECSFCAKHRDGVKKLIAGSSGLICNECIMQCLEIVTANPDNPTLCNFCGEHEGSAVNLLGSTLHICSSCAPDQVVSRQVSAEATLGLSMAEILRIDAYGTFNLGGLFEALDSKAWARRPNLFHFLAYLGTMIHKAQNEADAMEVEKRADRQRVVRELFDNLETLQEGLSKITVMKELVDTLRKEISEFALPNEIAKENK